MARAYPMELRERVVGAYHDGEGSFQELAERFRIGSATVNRWVALERQTGSVSPRPRTSGGHNKVIRAEGEQFIIQVFDDVPDSTIAELVAAYAEEFGVQVGRSTMDRRVRQLGFTRKRGPSVHPLPNGRTWSRRAPRS